MAYVEGAGGPNIFSLEGLIAWLETKSGTYRYYRADHCLLAQYFQEKFETANQVTVDAVYLYLHDNYRRLPLHFNDIAYGNSPFRTRWQNWWKGRRTFKGALQRAREYKLMFEVRYR